MLHEVLNDNRGALIARCRSKVAARRAPRATESELVYGIPLFLDQLINALRGEQPAILSTATSADIGRTASQHGGELFSDGVSVGQVVHDYGDLCQAVTDLAIEQNATVSATEFRTLNRCLDNAIADAVAEFGCRREQFVVGERSRAMNEHLGYLAHELRNLTGNAILAVAAIKKGSVGVAGATGALLDRSLLGLRDLVDRALVEVRLTAGIPERRERIAIGDFIAEVQIAAAIEAQIRDLEFVVLPPLEKGLAVDGDRQILAAAVANLLQNALKFTRPLGRISLTAYAAGGRTLIEVADECGGLPAGKVEELFRPFEQSSTERTGLGLGLPISRRGVEANGGKLAVRNLPGIGCVFTIELPRAATAFP